MSVEALQGLIQSMNLNVILLLDTKVNGVYMDNLRSWLGYYGGCLTGGGWKVGRHVWFRRRVDISIWRADKHLMAT